MSRHEPLCTWCGGRGRTGFEEAGGSLTAPEICARCDGYGTEQPLRKAAVRFNFLRDCRAKTDAPKNVCSLLEDAGIPTSWGPTKRNGKHSTGVKWASSVWARDVCGPALMVRIAGMIMDDQNAPAYEAPEGGMVHRVWTRDEKVRALREVWADRDAQEQIRGLYSIAHTRRGILIHEGNDPYQGSTSEERERSKRDLYAKQYGVRTGRLSSTQPNIANSPRQASDDRVDVHADYGQLEMRIAGQLREDMASTGSIPGDDAVLRLLRDLRDSWPVTMLTFNLESSTWGGLGLPLFVRKSGLVIPLDRERYTVVDNPVTGRTEYGESMLDTLSGWFRGA